MDDRDIFLSKAERYLLELINQAGANLGQQRVPEAIISAIAEQIFGRYVYQRSIKDLKKRGHLVEVIGGGYKVAPGLLDNPRLCVAGDDVDQVSTEQLRHLCKPNRTQPAHGFQQTDLEPEKKETGVAPRRYRTVVTKTPRILSLEERQKKSHTVVHWEKIAWQIAAELCFFAPLMKERLTFFVIIEVAHELGHKTVNGGTLIRHMIEKGPLIANHDGTWCLTDIGKHQTRSPDQTQKLSQAQRLAILEKIQALGK